MVTDSSIKVKHEISKYKSIRSSLEPRINEMRIKKFVKQEAPFKVYVEKCNQHLNQMINEMDKILLKQHLTEVVNQMEFQYRTYSENILSMKYDEINELDRVGLARYSRSYQIVYSLESHLAEILSEVFSCDVDVIKQTLVKNFMSQGLTYEAGSKATITNAPTMINSLTYSFLLGIHKNIDYKMNMVMSKLSFDKFEDIFGDEIDLKHIDLPTQVRFGLMVGILINKFADSIILSVLDILIPHFKSLYGSDIIFTSKGLGSIVINSNKNINPDDILVEVELQDSTLTLKPTVTSKANYLTTMV